MKREDRVMMMWRALMTFGALTLLVAATVACNKRTLDSVLPDDVGVSYEWIDLDGDATPEGGQRDVRTGARVGYSPSYMLDLDGYSVGLVATWRIPALYRPPDEVVEYTGEPSDVDEVFRRCGELGLLLDCPPCTADDCAVIVPRVLLPMEGCVPMRDPAGASLDGIWLCDSGSTIIQTIDEVIEVDPKPMEPITEEEIK